MLEIRNVTKYFPGVRALHNVSCTFRAGEIHALLGENGAGKSTLMKVICGMHPQDEGEVYLNGNRCHFSNYNDALRAGISVVNQELQVIPRASIAENIMLDKLTTYRTRFGLNWRRMYRDAAEQMRRIGLNLPPDMPVSSLSAAQKQQLQIAKALCANAKCIILDEPTSTLTSNETRALFDILRGLRDEGYCLIFISHKLEEVLEICDHITVLRDGEFVGTRECAGLTKSDIIEMMIGRKTNEVYLGKLNIDRSQPALEVKNITQHGKFYDVSFQVYPGEILGFYGLVGSGRTETAKAIIGAEKIDEGTVYRNGRPVHIKSVESAVRNYRIGYVSENRKEEGLILSFDITDNINASSWRMRRRSSVPVSPISYRKVNAATQDMIGAMAIKATGSDQIVNTLSGGNQQKVSIGKWLASDCEVLIIDEPTVGVDVGAKDAIHQIIWDLARKENKAIILISSDMPEIIKLSRRIIVFRDQHISGELADLNELEDYSYDAISKRIGALVS